HGREAAGAIRLDTHLLAGERRHHTGGERLHGAPGPAVEATVDVELGLRRVAREGRRLEEVRGLRVWMDGAHDAALELPVGGDDALARQPGPGGHRAQGRAAAV